MRLAHCSDLHLLSLDGARALDYLNKRWIGRMNLITSRSRHYHTAAFDHMVEDLNAQQIDHVICTGDVTNLALPGEFRFARARFDRLRHGTDGVTVLPGNHDAYIEAGTQHFAEAFGDYATSDDGWAWPTEGAPTLADRWPIVRVRGELALIGLSTSMQTPWFTAYGRVGATQLARLRTALADPRLAGLCRVVAIHHPPAGKRAASAIRGLKDRAEFAAVIKDCGADVIIHGHEHRNMKESLDGPSGTIDVLGIQSGTYEAGHPDRTARYRIFEISAGRVVGQALRVWHRDRSVFEADEHASSPVAASA
ncbi:MAG: metallophosphoesterase [Myxococcales bacterium]|nr:metallophosphoesterase [Myxococcales bacterium]